MRFISGTRGCCDHRFDVCLMGKGRGSFACKHQQRCWISRRRIFFDGYRDRTLGAGLERGRGCAKIGAYNVLEDISSSCKQIFHSEGRVKPIFVSLNKLLHPNRRKMLGSIAIYSATAFQKYSHIGQTYHGECHSCDVCCHCRNNKTITAHSRRP